MTGLRALAMVAVAAVGVASVVEGQTPPPARRGVHLDRYHGVTVPDPYRWMEDMDSEETVAWVRAQDAHARRFAGGTPFRDAIRAQLGRMADVQRYQPPVRRGDAYFYARWKGADRDVVLHRPGQAPRVIVAAEHFVAQGLRVTRFVPSEDGRFVAYAVAPAGTSWERWRVREVSTLRDLDDQIEGVNGRRSGVTWSPDGSGFYYDRFPLPAPGAERTQRIAGERLFFHRLGTPQTADRLVYDPGDEDVTIAGAITRDGRYQVLQIGDMGDPNNRVLVRDLDGEGGHFSALIEEADAPYTFVGNDGPILWFYTTSDAPRGRVIAVDTRSPDRRRWRTIIPETDDAIDPLAAVTAVEGHFVVAYRKDAWLRVMVYRDDGSPAYQMQPPKVGSIWSFVGRQDDDQVFYTLIDIADPGTVYRLDVATGESSAFLRPDLAYDPDAFVTRQVFYRSNDGTRIPMFISHHRDVELDGTHPTFMYGYGAFNWAAAPWYQPQITAWMQMGGIYALPNIRGGGEYGDEWYHAGIRRNKQTSIDDFLAAGEWLIDNGYTSRRRLVVNGGSASGPLVGAAITQRPDLFAASIIDYPALDMLRLEEFTGGRAWRGDFGTTRDPDDFEALLAYSPYQNVREGVCYPATMISPGELDESTVPMHAYKFTAALQHAQACDHPIALRVSWGAGHAAGATLDESMDTWADQLAFLVRVLDLEGPTWVSRSHR